ncbi:MAG: AbrB/MazE/SpoVT family DNA-binding domain-containing protein [Candidatus Saccharimonadales bacterium]
MSDYTITMTSKGQFTLPAQMVKKYSLQKGARLRLRDKDGAFTLKPEPTLREKMAPYHAEIAKRLKGRSLSDDELNNAPRTLYSQGKIPIR